MLNTDEIIAERRPASAYASTPVQRPGRGQHLVAAVGARHQADDYSEGTKTLCGRMR